MKGKEHSKHNRKPYQKPQVEQVELRPEEAVLGGCKLASGDPAYGNIAGCGVPTACIIVGEFS